MLLDLDLLEFDEFRSPGLQVQAATGLVDATIVGGALNDGRKGHGADRLVRLCATTIACVSGHSHHGLDFCASRNDTTHRHQFTNLLCLNISNWDSHGLGGSLKVAFETLH